MKRKLLFFAAVSVLAGLCACSKETATDTVEEAVTLSAVIPETKTELSAKDGDRYHVYWRNGDVIRVNGKVSNTLADISGDSSSASFTVSGVAAPYYAGCPSKKFSGYGGGRSSVKLETNQEWVDGSYDPNAFILHGKSDNNVISFQPAVCVFKLTPTGGSGQKIKSVTLRALNSNTKLSGSFTTNFSTMTAGGSSVNYVTVTATSSVALGKPWYLVMAPADFSTNGFEIEIVDNHGDKMVRTAHPDKAYEAGKVYAAEVYYIPAAYMQSSLVASTSSSLTFTWTNGTSVYDDLLSSYKIGLFSDSKCKNPVAEYEFPAENACWNNEQPRFTFGGLEPDTDYWFRAWDTSTTLEMEPMTVAAHTDAFTNVIMPSTVNSAGVVLAEDFGEIAWDFDYVGRAAGYRPSATTDLRSCKPGSAVSYNTGSEIHFSDCSSALSSSRLKNWAASSSVYMKPGYLKTGKTSATGWIATPAFPVASGKYALVSVTITAAKHADSSGEWAVAVIPGSKMTVSGNLASFSWPTKTSTNYKTVSLTKSDEWETHTVLGLALSAGDRIVFGAANGATASTARAFISDIKVEVMSMSDTAIELGSAFGYVRCGETPIANVVVSDGYLTTKTNADGFYSFNSAKKNGYVFISLPSGYTAELNGVLPQFYKYTQKSSSEPERIDFELVADPGQDNHTMLVFGDIHLANRNSDKSQFASFTADVNEYRANHPDDKIYAMTLGDMSWDIYWVENNFDLNNYLQLAANMPSLPIFHCIGNHDHSVDSDGDWYTSLPYKQIVGPNWYSFNIGKVHYMVVDNIKCTNSSGTRSHTPEVISDIRSWITKDLSYVSTSTPIVVSMHAPVWNWTGTDYMTNRSTFTNLFSSYSNVTFLTGHTHVFRTVFKSSMTEYNSGSVCACWWWPGKYYPKLNTTQDGGLGGYRIMKYTGKTLDTSYKCYGRDANYQFRTYDRNTIYEGLKADVVGVTTLASQYTSYLGTYGKYNTDRSDNVVMINVWDYNTNWKVQASEDNKNFVSCSRITSDSNPLSYDPLFIMTYIVPRFRAATSSDFSPTFPPRTDEGHMFTYTASSASSTVYIKVTDDEGRVYTETMARPKAFTISNYE